MVIASSDSTDTLVSLGNNRKHVVQLGSSPADVTSAPCFAFRRTALYLPEDEDCFDDEDSFHSCSSKEVTPQSARQPVFMPTNGESVDECLARVPDLAETCDLVLNQQVVEYTRYSKERILYCGQAEVVHALPLQADIVMSDRATTCHILAIRSSSDTTVPMVSVTHIDAPSYDECIRDMIVRHKNHHASKDIIDLDIHVMGGFEDDKGASKAISNWLMTLLADIADEERDSICFTLKTCAISCMNETGQCSPIGRGLAINVRTGDAYLARCDLAVAGPEPHLRSARLWARDCNAPKLQVVHSQRENTITIKAFRYSPMRDLETLLCLPDPMLLHYTSTSPDCEEHDFCASLRATLKHVRDTPCTAVFGKRLERDLTFRRIGFSNTWRKM